jgi:hypothetical protein
MTSTIVRRRADKRRGRPLPVFLIAGMAAAGIALAVAAWVGFRALTVKAELEAAFSSAVTLRNQIATQDGNSARTTADLISHSSEAASISRDPVWRLAEFLPWVGPNLAATRQVSVVVHDLATEAIEPLATLASSIDLRALKPTSGHMDVRPLVEARTPIQNAEIAIEGAKAHVADIDTSETVRDVSGAVEKLRTELDDLAKPVALAAKTVRLLPQMLGLDGPRDYLILFQNPAELRAGGGIPGALALIHADMGTISLSRQASSADFPRYDSSVLDIPIETRGIYGEITGQYIQNVTLTPQFPQSAQLAREMWKREYGTEVDGVISVDPVALAYVLKATGPVALATGDVMTAENAVRLLLSDAYNRYSDPADQDFFFASAASAVFERVASGDLDPKLLLEGVTQAGSERRILIWSAHEEDQAILAGTKFTGELPFSDDEERKFGVYLNDGTGSKMDYYLDVRTAIGQATCRKDERPVYVVDVTLANGATDDAAVVLPEYVTGGGGFGVTPGNIVTIVSVYGVPGMQGLGMTRDGEPTRYHPAMDSTYPVSSAMVELAPGQSTVLRFGWLGDKPHAGGVGIEGTPLIRSNQPTIIAPTCESLVW